MPTIRQSLIAAFTRWYPLYSGGIRFANHPLLKRLSGGGQELVWAKVKGGKVRCSLNDLVGRTAFYTGDLDRKISWICSRIVRPGDTVLDIGANVGIVSLWLSRLVGSSGRVHAFEPNPELLELLRQTVQRNRISNITVHPIALGPSTGQMQLRTLSDNTGSGSLIIEHGPANCRTATVQVETLDSVMNRVGIKNIRFIKIDVEGFEAQVFLGGLRLLESVRPQAILFEAVEQCDGQANTRSVFDILRAAGYAFFAIPKCRLRMHLEQLDRGVAYVPGITDYLAVQKNAGFDLIAAAVRARLV